MDKTIKRGKKIYTVDGLGYRFAGAALDDHHCAEYAKFTHALDFTAEVVLCGQAKFHMFLDDSCIADLPPLPEASRVGVEAHMPAPLDPAAFDALRRAVTLARDRRTKTLPELRGILLEEGYDPAHVDAAFRYWASTLKDLRPWTW